MLRSPSHSSTSQDPAPSVSGSTSGRSRLGMAGVANLFIRVKRLDKRAQATKAGRTILSSGEPITHPTIASNAKEEHQVPVEFTEYYVCAGGVNTTTLLRATRAALVERIQALGANTLAEEQWECVISGPKPQPNGPYKVQIRYCASATKSAARDPQRPVALDKALGIPGLMTIVKRNDA